MSTPRQAQKERTRKHILDLAFQQFAREGFLNVRTVDIAKAAGLSHGALFVHFPTREDLLTAVIEDFGAAIAGRLHELATPAGEVRQILQAHLTGLTEFELFYTRLVNERQLLPEAAQNTLLGIQSVIALHLIEVAEAAMRKGTIRSMSPHLFFNTWISLIHYYLGNRDWFAPEGSVLTRHGAALLEHFMALIHP